MPIDTYTNPHAGPFIAQPSGSAAPAAFHQRLPGYAPTPLAQAPRLAQALGISAISVKQESCRLGMPAFKILGASWAVYRAIERRLGAPLDPPGDPWRGLTDLRARVAPLQPLTLAAATDGNHGRAVARMAALLGLPARIYIPAGISQARIDAVASEGAEVIIVDGSYDEAVALVARTDGPHVAVISDTAWEGYYDIPRDVIAGYDTIFAEVDAQIAALGEVPPDLVLVQIGVGALAAAVVRHYRVGPGAPRIVGVEPDSAACVLASMRAGQIVEVPGPHPSIMAGLNAGLMSPLAWDDLRGGIDHFMAVPDDLARQAMRALAEDQIVAGETGAAGAAGLIALMTADACAGLRAALEVGPHTRALLLVSEGAADPSAYAQIVGHAPTYHCPTPHRCLCRLGMRG
jgi:diaminopropionate ammonia-lyase